MPKKIKNFYKNLAWNVMGSALPLIIGVLSMPVLVKGLGVELFGVLTILWVIIGYFSLFDLGIGRALTQQISKKSKGSPEKKIKAGMYLVSGTGLLGGLTVLSAADWLTNTALNLSEMHQDNVLISFYVAAIGIPLTTISAGLRGILEGYEKFSDSNRAKIITGNMLFLAPAIGVIVYPESIVTVSVSMVAARFIGICLYTSSVSKYVSINSVRNQKIEVDELRSLLRFGGWMSITNILSPIMINIDRFFISSFLGANSVALYTLPFEIITKVLLFAGALGATLLPKLSQEFEVNKAKAIVSVGKSVWIVSGVSVSSLILAASFGEEALRIFAGPEFGKTSYTVLIIISLGVIFNGIAYIYYTALHSLGDAKKTAMVHIVEFLVYLPAAYWLISSYGIIAAALLWATRALVDMLILYYVFKRRIAGV